MKKITLTMLSVLVAGATAFGQGQVNFANRASSTTLGNVFAPVYGVVPGNVQVRGNATTNGGTIDYTGVPLLVGAGFTAELWAASGAGRVEDDLAAVAVTGARAGFRTSATLPGMWTNTIVTLPFAGGAGTRGTFQIRVWDNAGGTITTWAAAMAGSLGRGSSDLFTPGLDLGQGTVQPPNFVGLTSFGLFTPVPEPSVIALGVLGLGALLLRRRK